MEYWKKISLRGFYLYWYSNMAQQTCLFWGGDEIVKNKPEATGQDKKNQVLTLFGAANGW